MMRQCSFCGGRFPAERQETHPGSCTCTYCEEIRGLPGFLATPVTPHRLAMVITKARQRAIRETEQFVEAGLKRR